jgi:hypothetical protein
LKELPDEETDKEAAVVIIALILQIKYFKLTVICLFTCIAFDKLLY